MHCAKCGANLAEEDFVCPKCGYLEEIAAIAKFKTAKSKANIMDFNYAGFWRRGAAITLDFLIIILMVLLFAVIIGGIVLLMSFLSKRHLDLHIIQSFAGGFGVAFSIALVWAYYTGSESSSYQATYGKRIMHIYVTDKNGDPITFLRANLRFWTKIISTVLLLAGFWMVFLNKKRRALHDIIAGALVLEKKKAKATKLAKEQKEQVGAESAKSN